MESLSFKITLTGTYWDKKPNYSIYLNDELIEQKDIENKSVHEIVFDHEVPEDQEHELKIRLNNKTTDDHVIKDSKELDMLLNIQDIEIDGISIGHLKWESKFILDNPQEYQGKTVTELSACVNLGWNGTYTFKFTSPFYVWLLEKL